MSKEIQEDIGPELLEEMREFAQDYPKMVELLVTMITAIGETAGATDKLSKLSDHLEMSRLDHEWKLNTLKELAMRQLHGSDSAAIPTSNSDPTIH